MPKRILVIDDEEMIGDYLVASLEDRGYRAKSVNTGQDALDEMQKKEYNLVIEDIVLPDIDGLELLARIKKSSPCTEVILITGHASLDTAIKSIEYGAFAYITKPFQEEQLYNTATRALEKQGLVLENRRLLRDLKESNTRLENLNKSLENRVAERARELSASEAETRKRAQELAIINEITNTITSTLDLDQVLQIVARETRKIVPFDRASISLVDDPGRINKVYFLVPSPEGRVESSKTYPLEGTGIKLVLRSKKPLIRPRFSEEDEFLEDDFIRRTGAQSGIVVPLIYQGETIGTLNLGSMKENSFTKEHEIILKQIAGQFAIAIKNAEFHKAVIEYGALLESRVAERTQELRENLRQLRQAQERLVQSEKLAAISKLIAGVAHEIKNPLNSMSFSTANIEKVLLSGRSLGEMREFCSESLGILKSDIGRLKDLVDSFMSFAKPTPIELRKAGVNDIIREVVKSIEAQLTKKRVDIVENYDDTIPPVKLEKDEFYRSILNLLLNSIDAVAPGGRVEINTGFSEDKVTIDIRDNGHGIPPEIRDKIFDVFFTSKSKGAGLGLSQVYRTIESIGGTIVFESSAGEGTCFHLTLPPEQENVK